MGKTIAEKIIKEHLISGEMIRGEEIGLRIDQTLTQDATGTMAYLELESMGIKRVKTELSVAYIDHNMLQSGFRNSDDHRYIQTVARKHGIYYSRPGNGICHQVHYERFGAPSKTLIGSDSHTPTCGGLSMLAMGAGGMDVAVAMGGGAYYIKMPKIIKINLIGSLRPFVTAKDIILEVLRMLGVKGGVGSILEYSGEGVKTLSVPERCTITNMGAELGATTSIFPSDDITKEFLRAQKREEVHRYIDSDDDATYDEVYEINLSTLEPLIACPSSPDNVKKVSDLAGEKVDQISIGSCTNSSLLDMMKTAAILRGNTISDSVSLGISPGSRQVLSMLSDSGALGDIIEAGARILECACGPCIGMGFSPNSKGVSLRTFNRNFLGRSGTKDAEVYLVSPETAAASALRGEITDPRSLDIDISKIELPKEYKINDNGIIRPLPLDEAEKAEVIRGPNIKPFPSTYPLPDEIKAEVILKTGDNITTDHIMPAGGKVLPYRSNIPKMSEFCFEVIDENFANRAKEAGKGIIVGGSNYGQGSSREHAALVPLYLGIKAVIAKSFARIHMANLINAGILPLIFNNADDYDRVKQGDVLAISGIHNSLENDEVVIKVASDDGSEWEFLTRMEISKRQKEILLAGGLLKYTVNKDV